MLALRPLALAFAAAAVTFAAPTAAADGPSHYRAELAAPAEKARVVAGGLLWLCEGTECRAGKDNSRPLTVCRKLARETSAIARFSAEGEELSADELARCNG
jgi:hypothetical protein